ncbi:LysR substrate-binding domain-containing protein [Amycolatopsis sp. NPDC051071]|uniref:LysR substrate-binding domain-containing protein n=1 Tax=Amycolatopsis sp. NPDC051071 TaxID=3154637 RepID=UPI0034274E74
MVPRDRPAERGRAVAADDDPRATRPHRAGEAMLDGARALLARWDETRRAVTGGAHDPTLTVGFQTRIGRGLIPRVTERMAPGWKPRFRQVPWRDPSAGLAGGEVDVAFAWRVAASEPLWVALPSGHRLPGLDEVPFADLEGEPFARCRPRSGRLGTWRGAA